MPKRVLVIYTSESRTGVSAKARKLESGLRAAGCDVRFLTFTGTGFGLRRVVTWCWRQVTAGWLILTGRYDIVFLRYAYYFAPLYLIAGLSGANWQVEVNTDSQSELRAKGRRFKAHLDRIALGLALRACRVHAVSNFLGDLLLRLNPKAAVIFTPNFVVDEYYSEQHASRPCTKLNVVFLGNTAQSWHGIPRFVEKIASREEFRHRATLHLVGHCTSDLEQLIRRLGLSDEVCRHGFLRGEQKRQVMFGMHVGISGFALETINLRETTGIKVGEYLYAGLPVILGYRDPTIRQDVSFAISIDLVNDVEGSLSKVTQFLDIVRTDAELSREAHLYAQDNLLVGRYVRNILMDADDKPARAWAG